MGEMVTIFSNYALNLADCRFIFEPKSAPYLRAFMPPPTAHENLCINGYKEYESRLAQPFNQAKQDLEQKRDALKNAYVSIVSTLMDYAMGVDFEAESTEELETRNAKERVNKCSQELDKVKRGYQEI